MKVNVDASKLDNLTKFFAEMPGRNERARNSAMSTIGYNLKQHAKAAIKANSYGWPDVSNLSRISQIHPAVAKTDNRRASSASAAYDNAWRQMQGFTRKAWGAMANILVYVSDKGSGNLLFGFEAGTYGKRLAYKTAPLGPDGKPVNGSWGQNQASAENPNGVKVFVPNVISQNAVDIAKKLTEGFKYIVGTGTKGDAQRRYFAALGFIFPRGKQLEIKARPIVGPTFETNKNNIPVWFRNKFWERLRKYCG